MNRPSANTRILIEALLAFFIALILLLLLYNGALLSPFDEKDDWAAQLFTSGLPAHPQLEARVSFYAGDFVEYGIVQEVQTNGRARFVYWIISTLEAYLFQHHPQAWQLETLIIGALTVALLYQALRRLRISPLTAALIALPFIWTGGRIWMEKQIAEEQGAVFFLLALNFFALHAEDETIRFGDWLALLCVLLMGWIKESFLLAGPALLLIRLGVVWWRGVPAAQVLRRFAPLIGAAALIFAVQMGIVLLIYSEGGYGAKVVGDVGSAGIFAPLPWLRMLGTAGFTQIALAGLLALLPGLRRSVSDRKLVTAGALIAVVALIPQLVLHNRESEGSFLLAYYAIPTTLFLQIGAAAGLESIRRRLPGIVYLLAAGAVILYASYRIIGIFPSVPNDTSQYTARNIAREYLLNTVVQEVQAQDQCGEISMATPEYIERAYTFLTALSVEGHATKVSFMSMPIVPGDIFGAKLTEWFATFMQPTSPASGEGVCIIASYVPYEVFIEHVPAWFQPDDWQRHSIAAWYPRLAIQLRQLTVTYEWRSYQYDVFVRR